MINHKNNKLAQILGQKSPFGGLCNCVQQKWVHANIGEGSDNIINEELSINMTTESGPTQWRSSNNDLRNANESCSSLSDSTSLNLTGGSITPTATISELAFTSCPDFKVARNGNFCISGTGNKLILTLF